MGMRGKGSIPYGSVQNEDLVRSQCSEWAGWRMTSSRLAQCLCIERSRAFFFEMG